MALILIADDSTRERQRLRKIVEAEDHIVVEADNSRYCLELIEVHQIDCALLNIFMAGVEEHQLLRSLQSRNIPAIAIAENARDLTPAIVPTALAIIERFPPAPQLCKILGMAISGQSEDFPAIAQSDAETTVTLTNIPQNNFETFLSIATMKNLISVGIEQAGETLQEITDCPIEFQDAIVETTNPEGLYQQLINCFGTEPICVAELGFKGGFSGTSQLFFLTDSAQALTEALTGEEPGGEGFEEAQAEMLVEIGNIVLNGVMGTISNAITQGLEYLVPTYREDTIENLTAAIMANPASTILMGQAHFKIEELQVSGDIILFFKVD